jgi:hypothetical protein
MAQKRQPAPRNPFQSSLVSYVTDARGWPIGRVVDAQSDFGGAARVDMAHGPTGAHYIIYFTRDYIFADAGDVLWDQPDCKGRAVIMWNHYEAQNALYKPAAIGPGRSIWIPVANAQPLDTWPMSRWHPPGVTCENNDPQRCTVTVPERCENVNWEEPEGDHTPVIGLMRVGALDDYYQPPYRLVR